MNNNQLTTLQVDWNLLFGSMIMFVFVVGMIRMVSRDLLTDHNPIGNPKRVTFDRGDLSSAIDAARRLKSDKDLYIVPTAYGLSIERVKPPTWLRHIVVKPDGTVEEVAMRSNPMKRIKIDQSIIDKLPHTVRIGDQYYTIIWERHADGMNFTSLRLAPEDLERLVSEL